MRRLILSADDFGLSEEVNEAIEEAHRHGLLSTASLMVSGPASADALRRLQRLPSLKVGLHLVTIEGETTLPAAQIRAIATPTNALGEPPTSGGGHFGTDQLGLGFSYFFRPASRNALRREIEAQFRAFHATGRPLDHANAHKHMHLHPTVGRLLITIGQRYGLRHVRTPFEPHAPLSQAEPTKDTPGAAALRYWCGLLRAQIRRAGLSTNDACFGLAWSGHMHPQRVARLVPYLPAGLTEIYFHPALAQNALLKRLMPSYAPQSEFETLMSDALRNAVTAHGIRLTTWNDSATDA